MSTPYETAGFYHFDGVAKPEFTVRREEESDLLALVRQGRRVYIDGPRRCGKTTLALNALKKAGIKPLRIDLDGVCTVPKLVERVASDTDQFLADHPAVLKRLTGKSGLKAGVEGGVAAVIKFSLEANSEHEKTIGSSLDALLRAVSEVARSAHATIVVDEFQAVKHPDMVHPNEVLGSFAAASDPSRTQEEYSWLFLGSNRHAMHRIFNGPESIFFQRTQHLPVGPIPAAKIIPFLNKRSGREVDPEVGAEAYRWTEGIPGDLQRLYGAMIGQAGINRDVRLTAMDLIRAKQEVLEDLGRTYAITLDKIASTEPGQMQVLTAIARDDIRDCDALAAAFAGADPKKLERDLNGLLELGLLHFNLRTRQLERPEPIFFHYLASFGGHDASSGFTTAGGALSSAFKRLSRP